MFLVSTLEHYLGDVNAIIHIDSNISFHKSQLKADRYEWEVFNVKSTEFEIAQLEIEREKEVDIAIAELVDIIKPFSSDYYVYSNTMPLSIEIHRTNCKVTETLKNGKFDFYPTFENANKKAFEICQKIHWDINDGCRVCKPYLDVKALKIELEKFYKINI